MRGDDGIGVAVVGWVKEAVGEVEGVEFLEGHQLLPEMAEPVGKAGRGGFVGGSVGGKAGAVEVRRVKGEAGGGTVGHQVSPEMILMMAETLYGGLPEAWTVAIGVKDLAVGEG